MNIKMIALIVGLAGITAMSSCTKCKICTKDGEDEVRICEKDYSSKTAYGFAIDVKEADGFNCSEAP